MEERAHIDRPPEESKPPEASRRAVVLDVGPPFDEAAVEVAMKNTQCLATLNMITGKQLM